MKHHVWLSLDRWKGTFVYPKHVDLSWYFLRRITTNLFYLYIILLASPSLISGKDKGDKLCMLHDRLSELTSRMDTLDDKVSSELSACPKASGLVALQAEQGNQSREITNLEDKVNGKLLSLFAQARHTVELIYNQIITSGYTVPNVECNEGPFIACDISATDHDLNTFDVIIETNEGFIINFTFPETVELNSMLFVLDKHSRIQNLMMAFYDGEVNVALHNVTLPFRTEGLYLEMVDFQPIRTSAVDITIVSNSRVMRLAEINFFQTKPNNDTAIFG